jgi:translation initiation factor 2B subunit (eIF-2B alpha/beta/delta family)
MSIVRLYDILNDRESGSITIALNALNLLKETPEQSHHKNLLIFNLMMTSRKEMSILVNLGEIGINMINKGYSLRYVCNYLIDELRESLQKSLINASLITAQYRNFLTISNSEQLLSFFSNLKRKIHVFVFKTRMQQEGTQLISSLLKMGINCVSINHKQLNKILEEIDCLVVGSDSIMPSVFSNRIGTMFLVTRMVSLKKPSYVLTIKWKVSNNPSIFLFDSKNFDLVPNRLITCFSSDVGNIKGKSVYDFLVRKGSLLH